MQSFYRPLCRNFDEAELPDLALKLLQARKMTELRLDLLSAKEYSRRMKLIDQYRNCGGLPGACFIKSEKLRTQKLINRLETILDWDLRHICETSLTLPDFLRFMRQLSILDGSSIQF